MIATDLDGTLLNSARQVSVRDRETLEAAGRAGIVRVIATGRSLYSARKVLTPDLPIDYLVYSSGVAAVNWPAGETVFANEMPWPEVDAALAVLTERGCDFMVQCAAPHSHVFAYAKYAASRNPDFDRRVDIYHEYAQPLPSGARPDFAVSQFVVVHPRDGGVALFETIRERLPECNVVRTTSPLDGASVWVEIFPAGISKADGCERLAAAHGLAAHDVMGIGNDFNDLDLLDWVGTPFVVANAPVALQQRFTVVASHEHSGFSDSVERWLASRRQALDA